MKWFLVSFFFFPHLVHAMDWSEFSATVGIRVQKAGGISTCSGILLTPRVILTAAHCVDGFVSASATIEQDMSQTVSLVPLERGVMHPDYRGNLPGGSVDIGLFVASRPFTGALNFPQFGTVDETLSFERVGFGGRSGSNVRTWIVSFFQIWFGSYIKARDELGVLGDSGGPVFQRQNGQLKMIGVHTGREISQNGQLEPISFIQPIGKKESDWIIRQSQSL